MERRIGILEIDNRVVRFETVWFVEGDHVVNGYGDEIKLVNKVDRTVFEYENVVGNMDVREFLLVWINRYPKKR